MEDINPGQRCLPNLRRRIRDIGDGHPAQERYMRLLKDGDTLSYQGNSEEVGCYVAGHPLSKGNCYFEVTIVDTGVRGTIAVGLVHKFYRLDHQPGWLPYSVAYHADNGKLYNGNPVGQQFGPKCARGDRIGCGIYPKTIEAGFKTVFFTKNGKEVGSVDVLVMAEGLFPAVGMHSMGEEVKVDLQAEWLLKEDDTMMMVDSHEDDWGRLTDVRVSGTLLEYIGKGKSIMDVGLAQARQPLTPRCHYYEVEIVDAGEKCYIALGLARRVLQFSLYCSAQGVLGSSPFSAPFRCPVKSYTSDIQSIHSENMSNPFPSSSQDNGSHVLLFALALRSI
ncbi:SPRY domain-containing protein 3 isoform X4 [Entelurus aequoreus]|uniref:SPRY domain-containing protein 3 isoform X4 n=1 Tax=Entelurus aequoreus TaxID=161455 RepID=UPI002B1CE6DD|nr:SPRY domain-containing protein 3 isoform X4 [Entelurus aequoreus]